MEFLAQPSVIVGLLAVGGLAVVASGACTKSKVQKKKVSSSNESGYTEQDLKKTESKKKSEKSQKKAANKKAIQDLIKEVNEKPTPAPAVVEDTPVVVAAPVEKKKDQKKAAPAPEPVVLDEKQAEINRLKKLLEAVEQQNANKAKLNKKPVVDEVYNPAPIMSKESLEAQRQEEAHWASANGGWTTVKKNEKKKEKVAAEPASPSTPAALTSFLEVPIAADKRGLIVGKGGETLKRLTELSGTKIEMPKADSVSNKIIIEGTPEACKVAETAIKELVNRGFASLLDPSLTEGRIAVEPTKRSIVIGEKAATLKKIQEAHNVQINMPERGSASNSVHIVGDLESVKAAKATIKALITEGYSPVTHEGWTKLTIPFPKSYRVSLIGQRGKVINSIQANSSCKIVIPDSDEDVVHIVGPQTKVYHAASQINNIITKLDTPVPDVYEEGFDDESALHGEEEW